MSDFLSHLIARHTDQPWGIQPRIPSRFEPTQMEGISSHAPQPLEEEIDRVMEPDAPTVTFPTPGSGQSSASVLPQSEGLAPDLPSMVSGVSARSSQSNPSPPSYSSLENSLPEQQIPTLGNVSGSLPMQPRASVKPVPPVSASQEVGLPTVSSPGLATSEQHLPPLVQQQLIEEKAQGLARQAVPKSESSYERSGRSHPSNPQMVSQRPPAPPTLSEPAASPPSIRVTIGRIDVRSKPSTPAAMAPVPGSSQRLSLEDYLKQRQGDRP